jgi:thiol:disulfide interchange protein DsbD
MNSFTGLCSVLLALVSLNTLALSNSPLADLFTEEPQFLKADDAFQFNFTQQGGQLTFKWDIAEGYYLYKKQFKIVLRGVELEDPLFPVADQIEDEFFGLSEVFYQHLAVTYPIIQAQQDAVVKIRYQGCAEAGLCYPPETRVVYLDKVTKQSDNKVIDNKGNQSLANTLSATDQYSLSQRLSDNDNLWLSLSVFLLLGIGLALTPCVFPMYPILSGIVIGQGKQISTSKAFSLSFVYVQGMAITYSLLGLAVASAGVKFQAALQNPVILIVFIVVFVVLALAMFGAYELQLPSSWQTRLNDISNKQKSGSWMGVFLMGAISGLVASPCTTAPLTGILLYIAESGNQLLGFTALYALSLGMGIPLILFGVTGGKLLPKAGNWMNVIKTIFGFMLLTVALVFVERMIISVWTDLLWAGLGIAAFSYLMMVNQDTQTSFWKGVRLAVIYLGLFGSALYGYRAIEASFFSTTHLNSQPSLKQEIDVHSQFTMVTDLDDFKQKLNEANAQGKSVMVDLYADWCVACKHFEEQTFSDPLVQQALSNTLWLQIDLTRITDENEAFYDYFTVLGLPTIMFFNQDGVEVANSRVTGFMAAEPFAKHVREILPLP